MEGGRREKRWGRQVRGDDGWDVGRWMDKWVVLAWGVTLYRPPIETHPGMGYLCEEATLVLQVGSQEPKSVRSPWGPLRIRKLPRWSCPVLEDAREEGAPRAWRGEAWRRGGS